MANSSDSLLAPGLVGADPLSVHLVAAASFSIGGYCSGGSLWIDPGPFSAARADIGWDLKESLCESYLLRK